MAQEKNNKRLPLIINDGIVYKKKDMLLLLRDLGKVSYQEIVGGRTMASGKGYLMRLSCNSEEPTLFLNGRVYINVALFDYLKLYKDGVRENTIFELYNEHRVMRIVPEETLRPYFPAEKEYLGEKAPGIFTDEFFPPDDLAPPEFLDGGMWGN
ncbi:MAG: hypothetical protein WC901_02345 [Candidatus Margulisiibacteriota bacterium]